MSIASYLDKVILTAASCCERNVSSLKTVFKVFCTFSDQGKSIKLSRDINKLHN